MTSPNVLPVSTAPPAPPVPKVKSLSVAVLVPGVGALPSVSTKNTSDWPVMPTRDEVSTETVAETPSAKALRWPSARNSAASAASEASAREGMRRLRRAMDRVVRFDVWS